MRYPPNMSVNLPKIRSVEVTTSDNAVDGHMAEASGRSSSLTSVGRRTFEPEI
jgi:hypothetical protein